MADEADDRILWDMSAAPPLAWRVLNEETQVASRDGVVVAIAYTVQASGADGTKWLEFCWILVDDPDLGENVHFGVAPGTGQAWDTRWDRARRATEWEYARHAYLRHTGG